MAWVRQHCADHATCSCLLLLLLLLLGCLPPLLQELCHNL
jgi:hypothetical protein